MIQLRNAKGFTMLELLVVVGIAAILAAISAPILLDMRESAAFRDASMNVASTLRDARSRAVSQNLEHRVAFETALSRYRLERGDSSSNSGVWTPVLAGWRNFPPEASMAATLACDQVDAPGVQRWIQFNPNGSANSLFICVMDGANSRFNVGVGNAPTGRVEIR